MNQNMNSQNAVMDLNFMKKTASKIKRKKKKKNDASINKSRIFGLFQTNTRVILRVTFPKIRYCFYQKIINRPHF